MLNARQLKSLSLLSILSFSFFITACVSGRQEPDTYISRSGTAMPIESDRESCVRSCNNDYERCNEQLSSVRSDVSNQPTLKPFGVASECRNSLKSCLDRCKGR